MEGIIEPDDERKDALENRRARKKILAFTQRILAALLVGTAQSCFGTAQEAEIR